MDAALIVIGVIVVFGVFILASSIRILREYERGVIFRLGRLIAQKGPGLILLIPIIDQMVRVDLRTVTLNVPPQEVITKDNVTVRVNAVAYFRVIDPEQGDHRGRELPPRHLPDRADDAALGARQGRARRAAGRARAPQQRAAADHRRADRALGDQGLDGRGQGRRAARGDAARDRAAGRGRARAASQDHRRRRRVPGVREAQPGGRHHQPRTRRRCSCATCRRCVEIGVNQNSTIVFPLPIELMKRVHEADGPRPGAAPVRRPRTPTPSRRSRCHRSSPIRTPSQPVGAGNLSSPELRIDQLTGLRAVLAPGRAERPDAFVARAGGGRSRRSRALSRSARAARTGRRPRSGRTGRAAATPTRRAGCSARFPTSIRRWRRARQPAPGGPGRVGAGSSRRSAARLARGGEPELFGPPGRGGARGDRQRPEHATALAQLDDEQLAVARGAGGADAAHADAAYVCT